MILSFAIGVLQVTQIPTKSLGGVKQVEALVLACLLQIGNALITTLVLALPVLLGGLNPPKLTTQHNILSVYNLAENSDR